ncbi:MAG TPA: glycosyltransferase family 2 protein [Arenimonas sp.]|nr:glycosyltransferase family 2 protein [Arenimonas sp.]
MNNIPLSACIITYNEADRIEACIQSLDFCEEIIVIDSGSTDDTVRLASDLGAKVMYRKFDGFRSQKQYAVEQAQHNWVICMDADEVVSATLRKNILASQLRSFDECSGIRYARRSYYYNRFLNHGLIYPDRVFRLFNRNQAGWHGDREIHEFVVNRGKTGIIKGDLLHYPYRSFEHHIDKMRTYARMMAEYRYTNGAKPSILKLLASPLSLLIRGLIFKLGLLDGWQGVVYHFIMAFYSMQKELYLFDLHKSSWKSHNK